MTHTARIPCDLEALSIAVVLAHGESICINPAVERATGYSRDDLASVDDYVTRLLAAGNPESADDVRDSVARWRAAKGPVLTLPVTRRDGAQIWIEHQFATSHDQELWILRDVSDRVAADRVARKQAELLKRVSRLGEIGGWEHILETDEMIWSEQLYRIHDIEPQTRICSAIIESLYSKEAVARLYQALLRSMEDGTPYDLELPFVTATGKQRWARMIGEVELENGLSKRWVGIMQDVTERYKTNEALREARSTAEAASRAKSEFLANMSHEIRTPMNGVIGMTELLLDTRLDDTQRDYAQTVGHSARALLTVINDILDFSKVEAGKLELECLDMNLHDTVAEVGRLLAIQAHAKNLELTIEIDPRVPEWVRGDAGRLRQVLLNLGGNAVKFTKSGEVGIGVTMLCGGPTETRLHFAVRDTGIGIPAQRLQALFQPFTQVDSSTTREFGGTGLGLSIVKRLVQLMGGETGVDSREGGGSCFWFTAKFVPVENLSLPKSPAKAAAEPWHVQTQTGVTMIALARLGASRRRHILVAEDNVVNQKVVRRVLENMGFQVTIADNGRSAVESWQTHGFDLILMDCQMPELDGYQATIEIRRRENESNRIPIVALTAHAMKGADALCKAAGMNDHLTKPIDRQQLKATLDRFLPPQEAAPVTAVSAASEP